MAGLMRLTIKGLHFLVVRFGWGLAAGTEGVFCDGSSLAGGK